MNYNSMNEIKLESHENAILLEDVYNAKTHRTLKLYIPKIMSLGNKGLSEDYILINRNKLIANSNTQLNVPERVKVCNYINVPLVDSAFRGPYREDEHGRIRLYKGERIICIVPNGNIKDIKATDMR